MENKSFTYKPFFLVSALVIFFAFCMDTTSETLRNYHFLFLGVSIIIILFVFRQMLTISESAFILLIGILLKTSYVLYTAIWTRQHDVIDFGVGEGHAGYIEYIYNNLSLPTGDPREKWAFFQPPLHHFISAVWMRFCTHFEVSFRQAQENVQLLTLFYISAVMILTYFICTELKLGEWGTRITLLIVCFHPSFIIMSGSINNDALSLVLATAALYTVILWYRNPTYKLILILALCIGLSMMAKLSGGTIAPAVAALFLLKIIKDKDNIKKYICEYIVFGIIVFPLGIWWEIRNMYMYHMPFNYIPEVGEQLNQSLISRIFDIRMHSVYPSLISNGDSYDEFNVLLTMLKTSLFDDYNLGLESSNLNILANILFVSGTLLALISLIATIHVLIDKRNYLSMDLEWKLLLAILYVTLLISYISFAFGSNNFSAMNFRYISMSIIVEALFLGFFTEKIQGKHKLLFRIFISLVLTFVVSSIGTYFILGFARQ